MYRKIIKTCWVLFVLGYAFSLLLIYLISSNWQNLFGGMPDFRALENPNHELASELWSADGVLLGKYYRKNRTYADYEDLSTELINTFITSEDLRFHNHHGIDLKGLMAIPYYVFIKRIRRGASTISQQLAKNLFKTRTDLDEGVLNKVNPLLRIFIIKIKECILAVRLEKAYTKKEIITLYLNTVDFGSNSFGIKVAAKTFFNITPEQLNIQESAVLVGILQGATRFNPILNPENSLKKRQEVLFKLKKQNYITEQEYDSLKQLPIDLSEYQVESHNKGLAPYFRREVKKELMQWGKKNKVDIFADGIKIYTTLDSRMQRHAEKAAIEHIKKQQKLFFKHWKGTDPWIDENFEEIPNFLENSMKKTERYASLKKRFGDREDSIRKVLCEPIAMKVFSWQTPTNTKDTVLCPMDSLRYYKHFLHVGLMAMDPSTGYIKAWVGGINHRYFKYDHVKQSKRQCGSTFKPIIYSAAIQEKQLHPCFEIRDIPISFKISDTSVWTPKNSSLRYSGQLLTLRQAMAQSINSVAAYLMKELGPKRVVNYAKKHFGISSYLPEVYSLCLGTADVSLYEMVGAYGSFVNHGIWTEPTSIIRIEDKFGKVLYQAVPKTIETLSEKNAYIMTYMLRGSSEEKKGTAMGLHRYKFRRYNQVGGKTGTTSNYSDGWFIGFTKELVAGVWVGAEDRRIHFKTLALGQGSKQAMPAFASFMDKVYADPALAYESGKFPMPAKNQAITLNCEEYAKAIEKSNSLNHHTEIATGLGDFE